MCGITGIIAQRGVNKRDLLLMTNEIAHRGPEGHGYFISKNKKIALGHRRLAIIDLSPLGKQPMTNEKKDLWITFNGEIYNYKNLKKELISLGHFFKSNTDTEVIIHAYEEWGVECVKKFNGMFAFALYDEKKEIIFLSRDRFGIKPLYYALLGNDTFVFASEIKSITKHSNFIKSINWSATKDYFTYRYIPAPKTIWNNVFKLEHAHCIIYDLKQKKLKKYKYYDLLETITSQGNSTIDEVLFNFEQAIESSMISDVEVGTFLSGGIDSSTITAFAKKHNKNLKTFSIGFEPEEYSELKYSQLVAKSLNLPHYTKIVSSINEKIIDNLVEVYDEPMADSSCIPTLLLCQLTSKHLKVVLSGDGGDEVFAGYNWYKKHLQTMKENRSNFVRLITNKHINKNNFENYYNKLLLNRFDEKMFGEFFTKRISALIKKENSSFIMKKYYREELSGVRALQYVDLNTFMIDDALVKVDRASASHSLEVRVPFLDHNLIESVWRLPKSIFSENETEKTVLKKIAENKIPKIILNKSKKGFSAPLTQWSIFQNIEDEILRGELINDGIINKEFIEKLKNNSFSNSQSILWMIFIFERWYLKWAK